MAYMTSGALGAVAAVVAMSAVHFEVAAGSDKFGPVQRGDAGMIVPMETGETAAAPTAQRLAVDVNRVMKADRIASAASPGGLTLSFKVPSIPETSVLMRVPPGETADALRNAPASTTGKASSKGPSDRSTSSGQRPVACEPVVSVLTAVARQLEAGRCVT